MQQDQPDFAEKIIAVNSDLTQPELNLSKADQSILAENIDIVFHCAATVRFSEPLKWVIFFLFLNFYISFKLYGLMFGAPDCSFAHLYSDLPPSFVLCLKLAAFSFS